MAQAEIEKTLDVSKEKLLKVITDYEKYTEFVDGMRGVTAQKNADGTVSADYDVNTMGKEIKYSLKLTEKPDAGIVNWTLIKSDFFKKNDGGWVIESTGANQCKVKYWLDVEFAITIPGFILKGLIKNSLPGLMNSFYERAKKL